MTKARAELTELEGAVLGVIRRAPGLTAYRVRHIFLRSPSVEWSGSAGAVYPALNRLLTNRLLSEEDGDDRRGTRKYYLTRSGGAAHDRWLCDVTRAASPGLDPFRTRAGLWRELPKARWQALATALRAECLASRRQLIESLPSLDEGDTLMTKLHIELMDIRLRWIDQNSNGFAKRGARST